MLRTAETLQAIINSKSAISLQRGPVDPKFQVEGVAPTNHSFSRKTTLNDLSYGIKIGTDFFFRLPRSPVWVFGFGTTYSVHLTLIGKRVVDFLLVLTELFSMLRLKRFEQISTIGVFAPARGQLDPKFYVEGVAPTNILLVTKLG